MGFKRQNLSTKCYILLLSKTKGKTMQKVIITKHGKKRLKQREGLPKRVHLRHIHKVLMNGVYEYRDKQKNIFYIVHNSMQYVFGLTDRLRPVFITVFTKQY